MNKIISSLEDKLGIDDLVERLSDQLSGSELNSLLLALFQKCVEQKSPADLLRAFGQNRFVAPSQIDPIQYRKEEAAWLMLASELGYHAVELSPLAPLGSCAVYGFVNQNKVVSALRGCEILSDATNMLALHIAHQWKEQGVRDLQKYCCSIRQVRAQSLIDADHTAHFGLFCMAAGGLIEGGTVGELALFAEHIGLYHAMLGNLFQNQDLSVDIEFAYQDRTWRDRVLQTIHLACPDLQCNPRRTALTGYYSRLRFRFYLDRDSRRVNLADGGFVDWTKQLLSNNKHRLMISGVGLELIHRMTR